MFGGIIVVKAVMFLTEKLVDGAIVCAVAAVKIKHGPALRADAERRVVAMEGKIQEGILQMEVSLEGNAEERQRLRNNPDFVHCVRQAAASKAAGVYAPRGARA